MQACCTSQCFVRATGKRMGGHIGIIWAGWLCRVWHIAMIPPLHTLCWCDYFLRLLFYLGGSWAFPLYRGGFPVKAYSRLGDGLLQLGFMVHIHSGTITQGDVILFYCVCMALERRRGGGNTIR